MATSFPIYRPSTLHVVSMKMTMERQQELSATRGGSQLGIDLGAMLWSGDWESAPMEETEFGEARAFFDMLAHENEFYGYDDLREYPVYYRDNGWTGLTVGVNPFAGVCYLTEVAPNGVDIVLSSLPVGFILKAGDYLAFDYGAGDAKRALHRVSVGGAADGSGAMSLEVRPPVRVGWEGSESPGNRPVSLYRPSAKMLVVPGSYSETVNVNRTGTISFKAIQSL